MTGKSRAPIAQDIVNKIIIRCERYSKKAEERKPFTLNALAYRYGIANSTVNKLAKGWESKSLNADIVAEIRAGHQIGLLIDEEMKKDMPTKIAKDYDVSHNTVRNIYTRHKAETGEVATPKIPTAHRFLSQPLTPTPGSYHTYY